LLRNLPLFHALKVAGQEQDGALGRNTVFGVLVAINYCNLRRAIQTSYLFSIYSGSSRSKVCGGHRGEYVKLWVHRGRAMRASDEVTGATNQGLGLHAGSWRHADP
jgi:hypothetical protein